MILSQQNIFIQLDRHLCAEYEDRELMCLDDYKIDDTLAFSFYHRIIDKKIRINSFNSVDMIFDIQFISQDIKFLTGLLFLLRPFINIPSEEGGTYFQNRYDARYLPLASLAHQNVYNFWDRIGDLLYFFFDTGLEERKVYFATVMSHFPNQYRSSEYFIKLNDLYEQKIKSLITARTQIVHYKQIETKHYLG
ncbi:MAG: Cthe_2314 family HEPN domain-containing protein [Ignavibacteriales bacterium]|nr:Cthe_2314 family HEPN domain-containing protein [Ignavibacteriales bacterium]